MSYIVTARKWRPMVFEDVVGQSHVTTTLSNAILSNRLAHAYIFSGPRGCGKTTTARILAKAVNCLHPDRHNPDNRCELCMEITEGRSVNVFEIDGASNRGIEEIRSLRDSVRYAPARGAYKVYIIDEVHMLTKEAFNALLKTLEEPPPHVLFIFATTEAHKVPVTILSRCQRFDFHRNSIDDITSRLAFIAGKEKIRAGDGALALIARKADGSMRDAQSLFDQIISFCGTTIEVEQIAQMLNIVDQEMFFRVTDLIREKDTRGALALVDDVVRRGYDFREFLGGLCEHLRNFLIAVATGSAELIEASEQDRQRYVAGSSAFADTDLLRLIRIATEADAAVRWSQQPRYKLEIALLQMIRVDRSVEIGDLLRRLDEVKKKAGALPPEPRREIAPRLPEQSTEAPIRGSVRASLPTVRTDPPPPAAAPLSPLEFRGKWPQIVDEATKARVALGAMLSGTVPVDVVDNALRVGCPDDFHLDQFRRNREFLSQIAERVFGAKVRLEGVLAHAQAAGAAAGEHPASSGPPADISRHPVVQALIREFGAKPID